MRHPVVDRDTCIGCGTCAVICPEVFQMDAEGKSIVISGADLGALLDKIEEAKGACPVGAIRWQE